ncbi:hypothetical protein XMM379_000509 [Aliiroseovarius sp. xm-m-379]|uniref:DUF4041 domain-containing protein n=1 Tax=unclassified Aliiroseovarius TaxID=2623558 RepID=UPI00156A62EF|nr:MULTISPECIES: DUF4041 domain-containing protein [unclassified Aliiroseovarius]NRP11340.1 hypothetical protein [Aliiroseovarius sp. xm-d-517]NRP23835.1 hypothetical protein [Aliiroseovarius sp. xm-m-379]NRP28918.1 hypothetical protein [Aliiroseovarius sp. xm-m-314]NRP32634.1 hypothetical protein [Aliiroseovarius sp. xm-a-104]NRP42587.1 hypothetical protein [Aliiroseovarius sp. xm-m-339-2]
MELGVVFAVIWMIGFPLFLILWIIARRKQKRLQAKYAQIISIDEEVGKLRDVARGLEKEIDTTREDYGTKRKLLDRLKEQVAAYDERLSFAELGVYEPHFEFGDSEIYKEQIKKIRAQQKKMVSEKRATICPTDWQVDGSRAKGQTMINRQTRLTMRAFNNECEAAIANTRWNNVVAMEKRILNAAKAISKENTSMNLSLNEDYVALKIDELHLTHEYREQLKVEKDERAELARAEREEKKLLAEARAAEKEEQKYQTLLEKARKEAGLSGDEEGMKQRLADLEAALEEARAKSERAKAMAEMTKSGFVYIISNVGSFGEDMVKIGLTRRLDPNDRVKELGDASVPFGFDTHAMIYSEEAPALEAALHKEFSEQRVNMANMRKEFFRVSLADVEEAVLRLAPEAEFFKDREAQEWHETMARRKEQLKAVNRAESEEELLPDEI